MFRSLLRQPMVHFFAFGAALFALYAVIGEPEEVAGKPRIVVSTQDAQWLAAQFEATWRRPPSAGELEGLIDEFVREEIYVREALALGLDQGDTIVRRRLRQKMEFLSEAGAEAASPDDATLMAHYEENAEAFSTGAQVAFSQILLPPDGSVDPEEARAALQAGAPPEGLAQATLLPAEVPLSPRQAVDGSFGAGFFDRVSDLPEGVWGGPIPSGYGQHLVRVDGFEAGALPSLDTIRDRVELDWRTDMASELRARVFDELEAQYVITRPDPAEIASQ